MLITKIGVFDSLSYCVAQVSSVGETKTSSPVVVVVVVVIVFNGVTFTTFCLVAKKTSTAAGFKLAPLIFSLCRIGAVIALHLLLSAIEAMDCSVNFPKPFVFVLKEQSS